MTTPPLNRRSFLRALWLASLGALAVILFRRSCPGSGACGGCNQFNGCSLPWKETPR